MSKIIRCSNCVMPSTRPRISFNEKGWCNACQWMEKKKTLDWKKRFSELGINLNKYKSNNDNYDCIVAVSGGKDGSYVSHQLKTKFGVNPLTVTVRPPLEMELGNSNLRNFISSGFDHIHITPNKDVMRELNTIGFEEMGFPYYGWVIAIHSAVIRIAVNFGIKLIFYGENGEVEYGGNTDNEDKSIYDNYYHTKFILEDSYEKIFSQLKIKDKSKLYFFEFPKKKEMEGIGLSHYSYYENWDPYRNYLVAKEYCGLKEKSDANLGTFTNFAQTDQDLYILHSYLMFLKFGFGRATADASIEVRRGAMTREQAINLVNIYDGRYPEEYIDSFLSHYQMSVEKFNLVLDKFANKELLIKKDGKWVKNFSIK